MKKSEKRQRIDARLDPTVLQMLKAIEEMYGTTRTLLLELGALLVCDIALDALEDGG